jgi:hypothetical protein
MGKHKTDRDLRGTLLHEMAHAASPWAGHTVPFFAQMERLIKRGAPVTISFAEAGAAKAYGELVPKRFRLLRAKMQRVEAKRGREVAAWQEAHPKIATEYVEDEHIVMRFTDAASCLTWNKALVSVGLENGMTDESGRPLNAWARRVIAKGRAAHGRARRDYLGYEKRRRELFGGSSNHRKEGAR